MRHFRKPISNRDLLLSIPIVEGCLQGELQTVLNQFRQRRLSRGVGFRLTNSETGQLKNSHLMKPDSLYIA